MENQDLDLLGKTVGNMPYKVGIVDKDGKVTNQFVVNASTNRIDIPQAILEQNQIPPAVNLFKGSAVGNIFLAGPTENYDNVQDGLLITFGDETSTVDINTTSFHSAVPSNVESDNTRFDVSTIGLKTIKIPKEKLVVNSSFDFSSQLSQYINKSIKGQYLNKDTNTWDYFSSSYTFKVSSFGGTTVGVLPNTTLSINLTVNIEGNLAKYGYIGKGTLPIPVIHVCTYKN